MVWSLLVSGAAAWWRNITGILDVTAPPYSADNTGSVDVSAALQAAIDFARLNGTVVFLPLGVYRITQQVNISMATRSAGVVIEGQVPTTTIVTGSAPTSPREHQRPVLYVPPDTPAFSDDSHPRYVLFFYARWGQPDHPAARAADLVSDRTS